MYTFPNASKGNHKMTALFFSQVCHIPYDTYVRKPILFRDTLMLAPKEFLFLSYCKAR